MIIRTDSRHFTDELTNWFYTCPNCLFDHVPCLPDDAYAREFGDADDITAKFCPGCGLPIEWV